jgi:ATP-dependent RNA helicase DDX1
VGTVLNLGSCFQAFKDGEKRFLICTDVAARGIDIRGVPFVINFTMPDEKENYIHRIGTCSFSIKSVSQSPRRVRGGPSA